MPLRDDSRGQAIQVGAVLLLATLVILLSLFQATVVPSENRQVEFNDYQDASADVTDLRNALLSAAADGSQRGVTVRTGSRYPARALFVNPPPANGRIRTTPARNVTIWNATATGPGNVGAYWDGTRRNFSTRRVAFVPAYHELDVPPVATAAGFVFRNATDPLPVAAQTLVRGNRITLVTVAGDLDAGGLSAAVTADPVSPHVRSVTVTNGSGAPLNLTVPTPFDPAVWRSTILSGQLDPPGGPDLPDRYVRSVGPGPRPNTVNISLEGNRSYELRLARVELREDADTATEGDPPARYLVSTTASFLEEGPDGRARLVVEARDRFNNPRADVPVTFNATVPRLEDAAGTNLSTTTTVRTDEDGRAVVWFNGTARGVQTVDTYLGPAVDDGLAPEKRLTTKVLSTGSGGGGGSGGGEGAVFILLEGVGGSPNTDSITFTLNNTASTALNVTGIQLAQVTEKNAAGGMGSADFVDGASRIVSVTLGGSTRPVNATEQLKPSFFASDPLTMAAGTNTLTLEFDVKHSNHANDQVLIRFHLFLEGGITATYDQIVFVD